MRPTRRHSLKPYSIAPSLTVLMDRLRTVENQQAQLIRGLVRGNLLEQQLLPVIARLSARLARDDTALDVAALPPAYQAGEYRAPSPRPGMRAERPEPIAARHPALPPILPVIRPPSLHATGRLLARLTDGGATRPTAAAGASRKKPALEPTKAMAMQQATTEPAWQRPQRLMRRRMPDSAPRLPMPSDETARLRELETRSRLSVKPPAARHDAAAAPRTATSPALSDETLWRAIRDALQTLVREGVRVKSTAAAARFAE